MGSAYAGNRDLDPTFSRADMFDNGDRSMKRIRKSTRDRAAVTAAEFMLAPAVVMMRLPLLAAEAQAMSPAGRETLRAVGEKAAAAAEGAVAAQLSLVRSAASFWSDVMSGRTPAMLNGVAVERSLHAALRPAGRRVKANYRRLTR